jgi:alpha-L-fucosidase
MKNWFIRTELTGTKEIIMKRLIPVFVFCLLVSCSNSKNQMIVSTEFVFQNEWQGQCHSSTIVEKGDGELMAAWFAGSHEGADDVGIWASFYENSEWKKPFLLAEAHVSDSISLPCWNPVLYLSSTNRLFLFYKVGKNPREWWGMMKYSDDNGIHWSNPERLPDGVLGPIKNKPVDMGDGTFLCPSSVETVNDVWKAHLEVFSNEGRFIRKIELDHGDSIGAIQPSVLRYSDTKLQILCRSRQNYIAQSWSFDGGKTWGQMSLLKIKNPNSGIDAVFMDNGKSLLVYNPLVAGENWWNGRNVLSLAVSSDGLDWKEICFLEKHDSGEYSYPAIIQDSKGWVHILYTWDRKRIKHVVVNSKEI